MFFYVYMYNENIVPYYFLNLKSKLINIKLKNNKKKQYTKNILLALYHGIVSFVQKFLFDLRNKKHKFI